jgi:outer membrane protein insertion porin family
MNTKFSFPWLLLLSNAFSIIQNASSALTSLQHLWHIMNNGKFLLGIAPLLLAIAPLHATPIQKPSTEIIEKKNVAKIEIVIDSQSKQSKTNVSSVQSQLTTKVGDPFSQKAFDYDLKKLSEQFDRVDPYVTVRDGQVYITLRLHEKPLIRSIVWTGNQQVKTKTLQKELGIEAQSIYTKDEFIKAFNKVKDYYVKHGYFEAILSYTVEPVPKSNEIIIKISVNEGRSAHIHKIRFTGLTSKEESAILDMINTKKYNLFTSWLTGTGVYRPEAIDHDRMTIVNFLQNEGYADAQVSIKLEETKSRQLIIAVYVKKGALYKIGSISINGNSIKNDEEISAVLGIKKGDTYSPDAIRKAAQNIKDLYGKEGRIDSNAEYELRLNESAPIYNIEFYVHESNQFKVGIIRVLGNTTTNTNVILNQSNLIPGEVFNSIKLQQTQARLESTGLFKSVNVYAVRNPDDDALGPEFRDINIEVEENSTGSASLFFGASSTDSIYGGLDISENNFNQKGLLSFWKDGFSALRGGGEFAHAKFSIGAKEQVYSLSWMNPYFDDSLWRVGYDVTYATSRVTNDDFHSKSIAFNLFSSYPLSSTWTVGWKSRIQNSVIKVSPSLGAAAVRQTRNSGIVLGTAGFIAYDSTDNILRPHRGIRSTFEVDLAGVRRHDHVVEDFLFTKLLYTNSYYYPVWRKGTLKFRADAKFLSTFGAGTPILLPANERFYLGGEASVRGYRPAIIGPRYPVEDPTKDQEEDPSGGASSLLLSVEYAQNIFKMLDAFVFFDAGSVTLSEFSVSTLRSSYGVGARIDIGNRLPVMIGYGIPINPQNKDDVQHFFFSMGGQF